MLGSEGWRVFVYACVHAGWLGEVEEEEDTEYWGYNQK